MIQLSYKMKNVAKFMNSSIICKNAVSNSLNNLPMTFQSIIKKSMNNPPRKIALSKPSYSFCS